MKNKLFATMMVAFAAFTAVPASQAGDINQTLNNLNRTIRGGNNVANSAFRVPNDVLRNTTQLERNWANVGQQRQRNVIQTNNLTAAQIRSQNTIIKAEIEQDKLLHPEKYVKQPPVRQVRQVVVREERSLPATPASTNSQEMMRVQREDGTVVMVPVQR